MARSQIQRRQEAERARLEAYEASLRLVSRQARPAPDFERAIAEARSGFETHAIRDGWAWRPKMKTRDPARLRLAAARWLYARYPVAAHLEAVWTGADVLDASEMRLRKRWYVVAAGGGSLYKAGAGEWLSRKEVHAFLNPLGHPCFEEAFWQAIARSITDDAGIAMRIAHSRIARTPRAEIGFWREVARFFAANPATVEEMNDLCDYLEDCRRENARYSLKGRTLASLRRQMHAWHHDLEAIARIEAARRRAEAARARAEGRAFEETAVWRGLAVADWSWSTSVKDKAKREEFLVVQLKSAADLVAETRSMRHCVASYATKCIAGHASIWSLRRRFAGATERWLTIEVDPQHRAVQIRGFANRPARPDERKILERWCKARGIVLPP